MQVSSKNIKILKKPSHQFFFVTTFQPFICMLILCFIYGRTKHVEIDYHFIRDKVALDTLITRFIPSSHQLADIFTNPLARARLAELKRKLGLKINPRPVVSTAFITQG